MKEERLNKCGPIPKSCKDKDLKSEHDDSEVTPALVFKWLRILMDADIGCP